VIQSAAARTSRNATDLMQPFIRPFFLVIGTLLVGLGVVGMFIPILPTTPFLLLAAACYARSSDRFLRWLLENRWFGAYIRNYREGRGMTRDTKLLILLALWLTLGFSAGFAASAWWLRLVLLAIGAGVSVHIFRLRTYAPGQTEHSRESPVSPASSDEA
jgi:uncharacterized membrane protein YbaN (DUF454 family)